jgi:HEPN domain-containing protein
MFLEISGTSLDYWFQSANEFWRGAGYFAGRGLGPHDAFLLHQAAERYFHAVLLVFTGYKPKSHDLEALSNQTAPFHAAMQGALPRTEENDKHHFGLLKRAYIDARYSKSYRVTSDELEVMRTHVLDLAERVRAACSDKLRAMAPTGEIPALSAVPAVGDIVELPELPDLGDIKAVEAWREAVAQMSYERGHRTAVQREGRKASRKNARGPSWKCCGAVEFRSARNRRRRSRTVATKPRSRIGGTARGLSRRRTSFRIPPHQTVRTSEARIFPSRVTSGKPR